MVYAKKEDAKHLKSLLENEGLLSRTHRMGPASTEVSPGLEHCIAIPVSVVNIESVEGGRADWWRFVQGKGKQLLPYRSSVFAKKLIK